MISILKITKGNNSAKRYNFHTNHIQNYEVASNVLLTDGRTDGQTDGQTLKSLEGIT